MITNKIRTQQGFSLLEILIAFSILALSLGILLNIFSGGLRRVMVAEEYQEAVTIAQSLSDAAGVEWELVPGEKQGVALERYNWRVSMQPIDIESVTAESSRLQPYGISITVQWFAGKENRLFELNTLKLAPLS